MHVFVYTPSQSNLAQANLTEFVLIYDEALANKHTLNWDSEKIIINLVNYLTGLYHLFWSSRALFGVSHCLRLAKVKLIGHPQIFLNLSYL